MHPESSVWDSLKTQKICAMIHTFSLSSMRVKLEQLETMNNNKNKNKHSAEMLWFLCLVTWCIPHVSEWWCSACSGHPPAPHPLVEEDSLCGESPPTFAAQAGLFTQPPGPRNACTLQPCPGTYRLIGDLHLVSQDVCVFHQETGKLWQVVQHPWGVAIPGLHCPLDYSLCTEMLEMGWVQTFTHL